MFKRFLAAALLLLAGCSNAVEPSDAVVLEIDRSDYVAVPTSESLGGAPNVRFTVVAKLRNASRDPVTVSRCGSATAPMFDVPLALGPANLISGYSRAYACAASVPISLAPGATRTDTLVIDGPTSRNGITGTPYGVTEGRFHVLYMTSSGGIFSPAFTVTRSTGPTVTLVNDGAVAFSNVRVYTSERDSLPLLASLTPGGRSGPYAVRAMHTNPYITLTSQGRTVTAHPIEGFSGFNPALPAGPYLVRVRLTLDGMLDVRVVPDT